jgi:hypothetical protein
MVKGSKGIEASEDENNCVSTRETHHVGIRPEEDRGGAAEKVGEGEGGEEGGLEQPVRAAQTSNGDARDHH